MPGPFRGLQGVLRNANVGCGGAVLLVLFAAVSIFGLVLMTWWPYLK
jgi:hypothetical protein